MVSGRQNKRYFSGSTVDDLIKVQFNGSSDVLISFQEGKLDQRKVKIILPDMKGAYIETAFLDPPPVMENFSWNYDSKSLEINMEWQPKYDFNDVDPVRYFNIPLYIRMTGKNLPRESIIKRELRVRVEKTDRSPQTLYVYFNNRLQKFAETANFYLNLSTFSNEIIFYILDDNFRGRTQIKHLMKWQGSTLIEKNKSEDIFRSLDFIYSYSLKKFIPLMADSIWELAYKVSSPFDVEQPRKNSYFGDEFIETTLPVYPSSSMDGVPFNINFISLPIVSLPHVQVLPFENNSEFIQNGSDLIFKTSVKTKTTYTLPVGLLSSFKRVKSKFWKTFSKNSLSKDYPYEKTLQEDFMFSVSQTSSTQCDDSDFLGKNFSFTNINCSCEDSEIEKSYSDASVNPIYFISRTCTYDLTYSLQDQISPHIAQYTFSQKNQLSIKDQKISSQKGLYLPTDVKNRTDESMQVVRNLVTVDGKNFDVKAKSKKTFKLSELTSLNLHKESKQKDLTGEMDNMFPKVKYEGNNMSDQSALNVFTFVFISYLESPDVICRSLSQTSSSRPDYDGECEVRYALDSDENISSGVFDIKTSCFESELCECDNLDRKTGFFLSKKCYFKTDQLPASGEEFSSSFVSQNPFTLIFDENDSDIYSSRLYKILLFPQSFSKRYSKERSE